MTVEEILDAVWGRLPLDVRRQATRPQVQASLTIIALRQGIALAHGENHSHAAPLGRAGFRGGAAGRRLLATARLSISAQMGTDLPSTAARARQMILAATQELLGLDVNVVDIDIVDLFIARQLNTPDGDDR